MHAVGSPNVHEGDRRWRWEVHSYVKVVTHSLEMRMGDFSNDENNILEGPIAALVSYAREADARARPPAWRNPDVDLDELRWAEAPCPGDAVMMCRAIVEIFECEGQREDPIWHTRPVWHSEGVQGGTEIRHVHVIKVVFAGCA